LADKVEFADLSKNRDLSLDLKALKTLIKKPELAADDVDPDLIIALMAANAAEEILRVILKRESIFCLEDLEEHLSKTPGRYQKLMDRAFLEDEEQLEEFLKDIFECKNATIDEFSEKYSIPADDVLTYISQHPEYEREFK
jgi:hypothetical protein